jgi:hypothetical protein
MDRHLEMSLMENYFWVKLVSFIYKTNHYGNCNNICYHSWQDC